VNITNLRGVDAIIASWTKLVSGDGGPRDGLTLQF
jgi:hypothetical protein